MISLSKIKNYMFYNFVSLYNRLKYKVNNKYLKSQRLTLLEICNVLNIAIPDELNFPKYLNAHYNICSKRMFYYRDAAFIVENGTPLSIISTINKGSNIFISEKKLEGFPTLIVDNVLESYQKLCAAYKDKLPLKTTIITTGSTGKTTSKNLINSVCSQYYKTYCIPINMNSYRFCGSIIQTIPKDTQVYIQEVNEGDPGIVKVASNMIKPDIAIVTNVGLSHFQNFTTVEELENNIGEVASGVSKDGVVLINADDEHSMNINWSCNTISIGIDNQNADCTASNIKVLNNKLYFTINYKGKSTDVILNLIGKHNIYNAMYAFIVADRLGISAELYQKGLDSFKTTGVRQNLISSSKNKILVDCFNAAPSSMKTAIQSLSEIKIEPGKKRVAILADMAELGKMTESAHKEVGKIVSESNGIDIVISYGSNAKFIDESITNKNITHYYVKSRKELDDLLKENIERGDVLLFKGSRSMHLEKSIKKICPITYFFKILLEDTMLFHNL